MSVDDYAATIGRTPAAAQWQQVGIHHHHGIVVPLFSLHSKNKSIGTYSDLIPLLPWCKSVGMDVIQLLPLNDTGHETSPYSALSAFALNPIHLNLHQLPHIDQDAQLQDLLKYEPKATLDQLHIDYATTIDFKEKFLSLYIEKWGSQLQQQPFFAEFLQAPWLESYALYKALKVANLWKSWEEWPAQERDPSPQDYQELLEYHQQGMFYHSAVQYLCWLEWKQVRAAADAAKVLLKGDLPILINRASADVWHHRSLFNLELCAGAPPDMFTQQGQNWGIPLYRWDEEEERLYTWWRHRLESATLLYHIYRLDHVIGFFRIWAMERHASGSQGHYFPADERRWIPDGEKRLRHLLASAPLLPIAEDLGVVPTEVRTCLSQLGICGTKVMRWERAWQEPGEPYLDLTTYSPLSLTTVSTHDTELLRQWWNQSPAEAELFCQKQGWNYQPKLSDELARTILSLSHHSSSLWHINLLAEYLALFPDLRRLTPQEERINLPGICSDDNWSVRLRPSVDELIAHEPLAATIKDLIYRH